ncbi:MAG: ATP-grasp domain-containing protein [Acholeplasmatales bacterium]|jgi:hypothetical protein|nr:ATP-grasp domain-containing protein [Acholeplasmatales bacterium]
MNFIFISPDFPTCFYKFVVALSNRGINVLGIGEGNFSEFRSELRNSLVEYQYCNLNNYSEVLKIALYYESKYGKIDYIESNNEYWLTLDAKIRADLHITTGVQLPDIKYIRYKHEMKEIFKKIPIAFPRFIVATNVEELNAFVLKIGYPLFGKPLGGVGGFGTFTINDEADLLKFTQAVTDLSSYIVEEFVSGVIESFDGICDDSSKVVIFDSEIFPISDALIDEQDLDSYYYCCNQVNPILEALGRKVVEAFKITKRIFHIEFFRLNQDKPGLGKAGDYIIDEVNMRSPGGNSTDLIEGALGYSPYEVYADIIMSNENKQPLVQTPGYSLSINRKNRFNYCLSQVDFVNLYHDQIYQYGTYPLAFQRNMGDYYYLLKFDSLTELLKCANEALKKNP